MKRIKLILQLNPTRGTSAGAEFKRQTMPGMLVFLMIFLFAVSVSAQNVTEYGARISALKASGRNADISKATRLESLYNDLQPTVYIENGISKTIDNTTPVRVAVDANSLNKLKEANPLFKQVELITIKLNSSNDLNKVLDLATLSGFTNLKYIVYICEFNCSPKSINTICLPDSKRNIEVMYLISIPN